MLSTMLMGGKLVKGETVRIVPAIATAVFLTALFPITASAVNNNSGGGLSDGKAEGAYPGGAMSEIISDTLYRSPGTIPMNGSKGAASVFLLDGGDEGALLITAGGLSAGASNSAAAGLSAGALNSTAGGLTAGASNGTAGSASSGAIQDNIFSDRTNSDGTNLSSAADENRSFSALALTQVSSVSELRSRMETAAEGDVIKLNADFARDLLNNGALTVTVNHNNNFTIDGEVAGELEIGGGNRHFNIINTGSARITFSKLSLKGGANDAGGIKLFGGAYRFDECSFNEIVNATAAIAAEGDAKIEVSRSIFSKNTVALDMGTDSVDGKSLTINDSRFEDMKASAVLANSAVLTLSESTFVNGGDTAVQGGASVEISGCSFTDNEGINKAGALAADKAGTYVIRKSSFTGNHNTKGSGGAISLGSDTEYTIDKCYFDGNYVSANAAGGAIYGASLRDASLTVKDSVFNSNEARYSGSDAVNSDGGAIAILNASGANTDINISGCNFTDNSSGDDGGAVLLEGGVRMQTLRARIVNSTFSGNKCKGAMDIASGTYDGSGGAIKFYGMTQSEITYCTFYSNEAGLGIGSNSGGGGAIAFQTDSGIAADELAALPVISNNIFIANRSTPASRGNVYIEQRTDAGRLNSGNIGLDNDASGFANGENLSAGIIAANVFADVRPDGAPSETYFGEAVGSEDNPGQRFCYIPSSLINDMYSDGLKPHSNSGDLKDVLGNTRDRLSNPGSVEIYWTKFDPGLGYGGFWALIPAAGVKSLLSDAYYISPNENRRITVLLKELLGTTTPDNQFIGWESDQAIDPDASLLEYPIVSPGDQVESTKQTYTAKWSNKAYKVEFSLDYDGLILQTLTDVAPGSKISAPREPSRTGYIFGGWYKDAGRTGLWNFNTDTVDSDIVLYAMWSARSGSGTLPVSPSTPPSSSGSADPLPSAPTENDGTVTQPDPAQSTTTTSPAIVTPGATVAPPDAAPAYTLPDGVYEGNRNPNNNIGSNRTEDIAGAYGGGGTYTGDNVNSGGYGGSFGFQVEPPIELPGIDDASGLTDSETPYKPPAFIESEKNDDSSSLLPSLTQNTEDYTLEQTIKLVFNNLPALLYNEYGDNIPVITIFEARVPLVGRNGEIALSFLDFLFMVLTALFPLLVFFGNLRKKHEQLELGYEVERSFKTLYLILSLVAALLSILTFLITQNVYARVILIDRWTVLMAVMLLISAILSLMARYQSTEDRMGITTAKTNI
ncbi:MAG: InlB B-repeat-containing protein [Clostridiales Family XIII bacterium]|nr:InlB B-repeat-containing protein [Clostridiales Family XIII bacterium]